MENTFIQMIQDCPNAKSSEIQQMQRATLPLVLYGTGGYAKGLVAFLGEFDLKPRIACVDKTYFRANRWEGLDVVPVEEVGTRYPNFNALIGFSDFKLAREKLRQLPGCQKIFFLDSTLSLDFFDYSYVARQQDEFQRTFDLLADEWSRKTCVAFVNAKISGRPDDLYDLVVPDQYFPAGIFTLHDREVFVDVGAYDGDTILNFIKQAGGTYARIYALEPDADSFGKLSAMVKKDHLRDVILLNKGAWRDSTVLRFNRHSNIKARSSIAETGETQIGVVAIDQVVGPEGATYIKMDVEGAELAALQGAEQTIRKFKPKLAVSVYHKPEDLVEIPRYLHSLVPGYSFYLRHHLHITHELVLYAVWPGA